MSLRLKFNLVMLATFAVGLLLASLFVHRISVATAVRGQLDQAAVMMGEADATIAYTNDEVAPLLAEQSKVQFLPQSIPFFAASQSFRLLTSRFPEYRFHQPATNPTNPADRPAAWEAAIIQHFRGEPSLRRLVSERDTPAGRVLSYSVPIRVEDPGCLSCHSTPQAAPATMLDVYGSRNGFGWHLHDVVGASIVSVPEAAALREAGHLTAVTLGWLVVVFALMLALVNLLLHFVIIRPVRAITGIADKVSLGDFAVPEFAVAGDDEIGSLARSFNRMRRSLENAMKMLDE